MRYELQVFKGNLYGMNYGLRNTIRISSLEENPMLLMVLVSGVSANLSSNNVPFNNVYSPRNSLVPDRSLTSSPNVQRLISDGK